MTRKIALFVMAVLLMGLAAIQPGQRTLAGCPPLTVTITSMTITTTQATVTFDLVGGGTWNIDFTATDASSGFTAVVGTGTDSSVSAATGRVFSFALNPAQVADGEVIRITLDTPCSKTSADAAVSGGDSSAPPGACDDGRINYLHCDKIAMYAVPDEGSFALDVLIVDHLVVPRGAVFVSAADLAALPAKPESNLLIATSPDGLVVFYKLRSGEYQVNYGPDEDNKVFSFRWRGLPEAAYPKVGVYVSSG